MSVRLVTIEKRNGKTRSSSVEDYSSVSQARTDMRAYIREWLDAGWERVMPTTSLRGKKPMSLSVTDGDWTITCTICTRAPRGLRPEPNLSE